MLPLIGAAVGGIGAIAGGIGAAHAMKKYNNAVNQMSTDNQNWYDKNYNADYTQRADAQALITRVKDMAKQRTQQAAGQAAIAGATPEAEALAKKDASDMVSNTVTGIAAQADQYKQGIMDRYLNQKSNLDMLKAQGYKNSANAFGQLVGNALNVGGNMLMGGLKLGAAPATKDAPTKIGSSVNGVNMAGVYTPSVPTKISL